MAKGRMLNRSIAHCADLANLSTDTVRMLHAYTVPHLDRDGLVGAVPRVFKSAVCPLLDHITPLVCAQAMVEWVRQKLVLAYIDDAGQQVLWFPKFHRQQPGLRADREGQSKFGPPPDPALRELFHRCSPLDEKGKLIGRKDFAPPSDNEILRSLSGVTPEWLLRAAGINPGQSQLPGIPEHPSENDENSGVGPELLHLKGMEGNGSEGKGREENARARDGEPGPESVEDSSDGNALDSARDSAEESHSPQAEEVFVELCRHPVLQPVATLPLAEQAVTNMSLAGGDVEDVKIIVRQLARDAGMAKSSGKPWDDSYLMTCFSRYSDKPQRRRTTTPPLKSVPPQSGDTPARRAQARDAWANSDESATLADQVDKAGF